MTEYDIWIKSGLRKRLLQAGERDVESPVQSVVYSGPYSQHGLQGISNRARAENYAAREGAYTLERTSRGRYLETNQEAIFAEASKLISPAAASQFITMEWIDISRDYSHLARGHVRAFVAGARKDRVFRTTELPEMVTSSRIQTINGIARTKLEDMINTASPEDRKTNSHWDKVYHMVALAGARLDLQQAVRTGDKELIRDALVQTQLCVSQMRLDRGDKFDNSEEAKAKRNAKLDRRANRIVAMRQSTIRAEQTGQNPEKTYRLSALTKLKMMLKEIVQGNVSDAQSINNYLNRKEQYQSDKRAIRQANRKLFVARDSVEQPANRRHCARSLAAHAKLKYQHRQGKVRDYAHAERELDQHLQGQKRRELAELAKPRLQRTRMRAVTHQLRCQ